MLAAVSTGHAQPDLLKERATPQDGELATAVERMLNDLWWRITCEMPSDLSRTAASILRRLHETGPQRITALAQSEPVAQPTMSVIVKRLGLRGLVERTPDPADARATLVAITPAGIETLHMRSHLRSQWFAAHLAHLGEDDRATLMAAVKILLRTLD
jgi:DNA-binding MarR family transcriptional regulator